MELKNEDVRDERGIPNWKRGFVNQASTRSVESEVKDTEAHRARKKVRPTEIYPFNQAMSLLKRNDVLMWVVHLESLERSTKLKFPKGDVRATTTH